MPSDGRPGSSVDPIPHSHTPWTGYDPPTTIRVEDLGTCTRRADGSWCRRDATRLCEPTLLVEGTNCGSTEKW
ncbi:MAG: hypothetical protein ACKPKO_12110, partial [Candidatus Fonsibacter sp.]